MHRPFAIGLLSFLFLPHSALAARLHLPDAIARPGESVEVRVELDSDQPVTHLEADLLLPDPLEFCSIRPGSKGVSTFVVSISGGVRLVVDASAPAALPEGPFATLVFSVDATAHDGMHRIIIGRAVAAGLELEELDISNTSGNVYVSRHGAPSDAFEIVAAASGRRRRSVSRVPSRPPTTTGLIDAALKSGAIDSETALTYHVFATFGDTRLPFAYRGVPSENLDNPVVDGMPARFDSLSEKTQEILAPFLIPPIYEGSWFERRSSGKSGGLASAPPCADPTTKWSNAVPTNPNVKVKVWWQKAITHDEAKAAAILSALENDIWPKLTTLMGRTPLTDRFDLCNGGDDRLDFYLVDLGENWGAAENYKPGCEYDSTFILLNTIKPSSKLPAAAAHEFMHSLQWAVDVANFCLRGGDETYLWFMESTATWAMDYVFPNVNLEQDYAPRFLQTPERPLEDRTDERYYGAYLFPFWIAKRFSPERVANGWKLAEVEDDGIKLADRMLVGGFMEQWPEFVLYNLNKEPWNDYEKWDGVDLRKSGGSYPGASPVTGFAPREVTGTDTEIELPETELDHLSARYYHFEFPDAKARTVTFWNGLGYNLKEDQTVFGTDHNAKILETEDVSEADKKGLFVRAIYKTDKDGWKTEDWSKEPYHTLCRDELKERITELVIILSNSDTDKNRKLKSVGKTPRLMVSNIGCYQYEGTASMLVQTGGVIWIATGDVTWKRDGDLAPYPQVGGVRFVPSGSLRVKISGTSADGCTHSADGTVSVSGGGNFGFLNTLTTANYIRPGTPLDRAYYGGGTTLNTIAVTKTCPPPDGSGTGPVPLGSWLIAFPHTPGANDGFPVWKVKADGSIDDQHVITAPDGSGSATYTWTFRPKFE